MLGLKCVDGGDLTGSSTFTNSDSASRLPLRQCALLAVDEMCVGDLALALDASEDAVSFGLRLLRTAELVRCRREGSMRYSGRQAQADLIRSRCPTCLVGWFRSVSLAVFDEEGADHAGEGGEEHDGVDGEGDVEYLRDPVG